MTACLFGTYDREHSANRLLRAALAEAGFAIVELHEPLWEDARSKAAPYFGPSSLARLGARWAAAGRRMAARWRGASGPPPLVVVGFGGHLDVLLARRVCHPRAALVFAPLVSLTETLVEDRGIVTAGSLRARMLRRLDRWTLGAADLVLADTEAHAAYYRALGAPAGRVAAWHLGAEPEFHAPPPSPVGGRRVLFYGRCLPLHGIDTILEAAARVGDRAEFVLIGRGPERVRLEARARAIGAPVTWRDDVPLAALPAELAAATVVLGVFDAGAKAAMVVPNKVYQAATAGRPLITRDGPALREVLEPGVHCLTCPPADAAALAAAVERLLDEPPLAARLGRAARAHMLERYGPGQQAARLAAILGAHHIDVPGAPRARCAAGV